MNKPLNKNNLRVSIILPVYNGEKFIAFAIESVLAQSYRNWELLVMDDGSTDRTANVVKRYAEKDNRIKYHKNEQNLGIQKTLNRGLKAAQGAYIARIDDDDTWCDVDKLSKQVKFLDDNPEYVLVGTGVIVVDERGNELSRYLTPCKDEDIRKKILSGNCFVHSSVMFRRAAVLKVGGYSEEEEVKHSEDYDLWLKLGEIGKFANLPIYAVKFTLRGGSVSHKNKIKQFRAVIKIAEKYKKDYPNYLLSNIRNYSRLILYGFFDFLPILRLKYKILKVCKLLSNNKT